MNVKAEAYQEYNKAAVVDKLITGLPEIVKALAAPLANVDKITIVSTGNGDAAGMNKITGDITKIAAQVPALFETLSGMPLAERRRVRGLMPERAPTIVAGTAILAEVLDHLGADAMVVSERDILHGAALAAAGGA